MSESSGGGMGLTGVLLVVFVTLKLTDHIDWGWGWVLSPAWIWLSLVVLVVVLVELIGDGYR
uniref:Uncharacterized protein n=1 Tax=viral metagenome TaxID=1070528 RepID=A0A6H2A616_9ZZZZ